jgi:16S rRNA (cytosine1402-N4)-methyltransferase
MDESQIIQSESDHIPVLLAEVFEQLSPSLKEKSQPVLFDGTFGRGGHSFAFLQHFPSLKVVATDLDLQAVEFSESYLSTRLLVHHSSFFDFLNQTEESFDAMILDLGVSSPQLDSAERGFSFYKEGPLDMRMNQKQVLTASKILNEYPAEELERIFSEYGEVHRPQRVVRALVQDRQKEPFVSTKAFSEMIARVDGWRRKGFHPATLYFQALRIEVNQELTQLGESLEKALNRLKPKGRLAVLTFHSLEDRIVKRTLKANLQLGRLVNKKVMQASPAEAKANPRSRSAKLRVFEKAGEDEITSIESNIS